MIDIEINCQKINDYLSSFLADENGKTEDKRDSNSFKNRSVVQVTEFPASKLPLVGNNESEKPNLKTNTLPRSIEEFHRRLKSFENGLWTCTAISPLLCAIYGWKLIKKDILSCVTCKALICTTLPLPNQIEAYETFGGRLKERLKFGHKGWCEWPNKPSPPSFLHPPLHMTVHYANSLVIKANNLFALGNLIPYINCEEILQKLGLEAKEVTSFFNIQHDASENHLTAAILVLCGWGSEGKEKLKCSLCFRSIGLWNFLALSEKSHYEDLKKKISEREERRKVVEEKKKNRERRILIKEEKLKAKLLEEKKAALAEMEAKENALKLKLALEKISKLESSDFSNPSDESEDEEEMGEEEENLLLNENGIDDEFAMEEEGNNNNNNNNSEPEFNSGLVLTTSEDNVLADADSSNSTIEYTPTSKHVTAGTEETHDATLDTDNNENLESDEFSKSTNGNESEEDLWLEAVGGYVEENESNMSKPMYAPSSEGSESSIDYPTDKTTHHKRSRSDSSDDDECNQEEITSKRTDYSTDNTKGKRRRSESSENEYNEEISSKHTDYPSNSTKYKRRRSESSDNEYNEEISSKRTDYPSNSTKYKRRRSESSDDEYIKEEIDSNYSTNNTTRKRHKSGSSDDEYTKEEIDSKYTDNSNRKRCRSESSEDEYNEEEIASKCRRVEDSYEAGNRTYSDIIENSNSCDNNENLADDINSENMLLPTETKDSNPESAEEKEETDEEEIEEVEEDLEEIASLNKMKNSLFLPLEQHRHWCGWVVDYSSLYINEAETGIKGYKIIPPQISELQPDNPDPDSSRISSEKYVGNIVGLRTVRGILDSWARHEEEEEEEEEDIQEC